MAQDAGGNYVDEESDYSFRCAGCDYWFNDIDTEGKYVPELPGDLCHECLALYKESLTTAEIKHSSLDTTDYDALAKEKDHE